MTNNTSEEKRPLELYIHIPFCARKCLYCDFLSFRSLASVHERYTKQLIREIRTEGASCKGYRVTTIFIGGGTPSVMEADLIRQICQAVWESFDVAEDVEATIEVNPGTLLQNKLPVYRAAGLNRVSIGLQSADNQELKDLGRIHSFEEFLKSYQYARMAGFSNINVDLMSAIPGQTLESWKNTLKKVTMLKPEHISAYSLIIEEGTPFWERYGTPKADRKKAKVSDPIRPGFERREYPDLPDEDTESQMYHLTRTFLAQQGYQRYEISNYAKPGFECRHNVGYWTGVEYLGLGLGASSYLADCRFCGERELEKYLEVDFSGADWEARLHPQFARLTKEAEMEEFMFLGLRMTRGISAAEFEERFEIPIQEIYGATLEHLIHDGLMKSEGDRFFLTEWGMDVSNFVLSEFLLA